MIKILLFAGIAEKTGAKELVVEGQYWTINELKQLLITQYPAAAKDIEQAIFAVNEEFIDGNQRITEDDIVAVIPPVSGG